MPKAVSNRALKASAVWYGGIGALALLDWYLDKRDHDLTLSEATRATFRTVPGGEYIMAALLTGFFTWYLDHLLKRFHVDDANIGELHADRLDFMSPRA